jgi:hypothetical protein
MRRLSFPKRFARIARQKARSQFLIWGYSGLTDILYWVGKKIIASPQPDLEVAGMD